MNVALREIGRQLDESVFPSVGVGGIVISADPALCTTNVEKVRADERSEARRPATEPGQRPARGQGASGRAGSAGSATSVVVAASPVVGEPEFDEVNEAYPGARIWRQVGGYWLLTESSVLPGSREQAVFLTAVSVSAREVRAWGFWRTGALYLRPIGPRHTNFPDGSVCGFDQADGTWKFGDSVVKLLDIYTLWALRHLHLREYGRWPGPQRAHHACERMIEFRDDEHCGCEAPTGLYRDCCKSRDVAAVTASDVADYLLNTGGMTRKPPQVLSHVVRGAGEPPPLADIFKASRAVRLAG
jgi:hypothetical protein